MGLNQRAACQAGFPIKSQIVGVMWLSRALAGKAEVRGNHFASVGDRPKAMVPTASSWSGWP
jgi:hypothetical protein